MIKQLICRHKTRGKKEHHVYDPVIQWLFIPPSRLLNTLLDLQIWWLGYAQTACWTAGHINIKSPIMVLCLSYGTLELSSCSLIQFVLCCPDSLYTFCHQCAGPGLARSSLAVRMTPGLALRLSYQQATNAHDRKPAGRPASVGRAPLGLNTEYFNFRNRINFPL